MFQHIKAIDIFWKYLFVGGAGGVSTLTGLFIFILYLESMNYYDDFIKEYNAYVEWAVDHFKPGTIDGSPVTVFMSLEFYKEFNEKLNAFDSDISKEAEKLLQKAETGMLIDMVKLRDEFSMIAETGVNEFVRKHKPG